MIKDNLLAYYGGKPSVKIKQPHYIWPEIDKKLNLKIFKYINNYKNGKNGLPDVIENFEKSFSKFHKTKYSLCQSSCTAALHTAYSAIGIKKGDEVIVSNYTSYPIAPKFLYNGDIFDKETINSHLDENGKKELDERIKKASFYLFLSFMLSAFLNFVVAKHFIVSPTGTEAFNNELGQMALWSYPIIVAPTMIILIVIVRYIYMSIKKLTNLTSDDIFLLK